MDMLRRLTGTVCALLALVALVACGSAGSGGQGDSVVGPVVKLVFPADYYGESPVDRAAPSFVTRITVTATPVNGGDTSTWSVSLATGTLNAELPEGTYLFTVVVETTMGTVFSGSTTATLSPDGPPPTITISVTVATEPVVPGGVSASNRFPSKGETVRLSVNVVDPDEDETLFYQWNAACGTIIGSGASVDWSSPTSGACTVSVTVTDERGDTTTASTTLTVTNRAPVIASATASSYNPLIGATVTLSCAATDPDNDPISYRWTGSDGFSATGATANYTVTTATTITHTCSADDGDSNGVTTATVTLNGTEPPPAAPGGLTATAGDTQVSLSWNAVTGATGYNVYWSTTTGTGINGTKIAGVTATTYTHTGRTNWTPLYYVVTAVGPGGEGTSSTEATALPRPAGLLVTKTADTADGVCDADCSLREAITVLNNGGGGAIALPAGTYAIGIAGPTEDLNATGDFDIRANITINGAGSGTTIIDGATLDRELHITGPYTVVVSGVTLKRGALPHPNFNGGGLYNAGGTLTLANCVITGNTAGTAGAIYSIGGSIAIQNSVVSNNSQTGSGIGGTGGGAIYLTNATLTATGTTFSGNVAANGSGGAIYLRNSALTATDSTFTGNHGDRNSGGASAGGAVFIEDGSSTASFSRTTFQSNYAQGGFGGSGGAIYFDARNGSLTISDSTFTSNWAEYGGAIRVWLGKTTSITRSTFNGNAGNGWGQGGAALSLPIQGYATVQVSNSTIVSNTSNGGGAVHSNAAAGGSVTITNCTIAQNPKYGINATGAGATTLINTILALNTVGSCAGTVTSGGNNIDSANTCAFAGAGDLPNTDPLLNALAANGGSTKTMALSVGSPAIDTGNAATCAAAPVGGVDQRGVARPRGAGCDIGAYEY